MSQISCTQKKKKVQFPSAYPEPCDTSDNKAKTKNLIKSSAHTTAAAQQRKKAAAARLHAVIMQSSGMLLGSHLLGGKGAALSERGVPAAFHAAGGRRSEQNALPGTSGRPPRGAAGETCPRSAAGSCGGDAGLFLAPGSAPYCGLRVRVCVPECRAKLD